MSAALANTMLSGFGADCSTAERRRAENGAGWRWITSSLDPARFDAGAAESQLRKVGDAGHQSPADGASRCLLNPGTLRPMRPNGRSDPLGRDLPQRQELSPGRCQIYAAIPMPRPVGAVGHSLGINEVVVDGDNVVFKLKRGNADLPLLLTDYHLIISQWRLR